MTDSRDAILRGIAKSLRRIGDVADIDEAFATLTRHRQVPVQPPLADSIIDVFTRSAEESAAKVYALNDLQEFRPWLEELAKPRPALVISPDLQELAGQLSGFKIAGDINHPKNWGIARANVGIAETGTVATFSEDCPSGMLFLVERLIVVIDPNDIVAYQEDLWQKLRQRFGSRMPRTVNLITGPSRTADVEQTIQLGAHGPRWVDYVLISNP